MVLIDTSIWVDHLHAPNDILLDLLVAQNGLMHPFVAGEVALGTLRNRKNILQMFGELPQAQVASPAEVMRLIERQTLFGVGIGYVDVHLLASVLLTPHCMLWTRDKRLASAATKMNIRLAPTMH
ncbi:type II toxin-antitoxin system VapC family toxin [Pararhizobium sp. O133]|uniref:type II toxin-antitoxin system VapC family toxin n=1 Tax=Pararhizobium sp. O133 TaxID=3449278 RepID=UPI003F68287E